MKNNRSHSIVSAFMFFGLMFFGHQFCSAQYNPLFLRSQLINFGKIRQGKALRTRIKYLNLSDTSLQLQVVHLGPYDKGVSCILDTRIIAPHDSGTLIITLGASVAEGKLSDSFVIDVSRQEMLLAKTGISINAEVLPAAAKRGPILLLENNVCDLGKLEYGSHNTCLFTFRNAGDEPLQITISADTGTWKSNDSLVLNYPVNPIPPGRSATIKASFRNNSFAGDKKYLQLECNMPENKGIITLIIKSNYN